MNTAVQKLREFTDIVKGRVIDKDISLYKALELISTEINYQLLVEKEQIIKAWEDGDYSYFYSKETGRDFDNGEEYYKDVYSTKEVNDDKYSIFDCHGMIVEHYGRNITFEKAKNLIDKLNPIGDGFSPYTIEKNK